VNVEPLTDPKSAHATNPASARINERSTSEVSFGLAC
jgi:hypothetical protein